MKTFLFRSMVGIFYGGFFAVIITNIAILMGDYATLDAALFMKNSIGAIFCGWFFTVSPLYFEINNLKLWQQTTLHFFTVLIFYFVLALGIKWIPFTLKSFLLNALIFIGIYIIIWVCFYLYFKNQAKKLNNELQHL